MSEFSAIKQFDLETYKTLVAFNGDILFEWDLVSDRFYATPNLFDIFGYMPPSYNFTNTLEKSKNLHPKDKQIIKEYLENIQFTSHDLKNKKYYSKMEIRIKNIYRKYVWCKIQLVADYSPQNMPYKISGMITNIDFDKKHQETLLTQAQKDLLTSLYNKSTTQKFINDWIFDKKTLTKAGVLVLIDLDGFKTINDHFGHLFGDAVIADTATIINSHFLESDIVGRMGGDEFTVFIKEVSSIANLKSKLKNLNLKLMRSYQSQNTTYDISASIGVALYPAHGKNFEELFSKADQALYYIKEHGKNDFMLYRERLPKTLHKEELPDDLMSLSNRSFDDNLLEYIFKILYTTKDIPAAIKMLLAVIGKKLKVSRTLIYRKNLDCQCYEKVFEWHESNITDLASTYEKINTLSIDSLDQSIKPHHIFICKNTDYLKAKINTNFISSNTQAFLHSDLVKDHQVYGFIRFDECSYEREWTSYEISIINFLAEVLMTFIEKQDYLMKLNESYFLISSLLNLQKESSSI